jgi:hypothetical protein
MQTGLKLRAKSKCAWSKIKIKMMALESIFQENNL